MAVMIERRFQRVGDSAMQGQLSALIAPNMESFRGNQHCKVSRTCLPSHRRSDARISDGDQARRSIEAPARLLDKDLASKARLPRTTIDRRRRCFANIGADDHQ